jgi:diguanylate cyclase (GGDEF)-like protein
LHIDFRLPPLEASPRPRWLRLSRPNQRPILAGAGLILVIVAAIGLAFWQSRCATLREAQQSVNQIGIAIAEQTARSFQAVALILQSIQADIVESGITTPEQFRTVLQDKATYEDLRHRDSGLPQANAFTIIGADGRLINFSRRWPVTPTDLSDRPYFQYFRTHDDKSVMISGPIQNRGDGKWTVYVIQRVDGPSGQFLGLLLGAIDLNYFNEFYKVLSNDGALNILLLKTDGEILASSPPPSLPGRLIIPGGSVWHAAVAAGRSTIYTAAGLLMPGLRIISVRPLTDYPLVVDVSLSQTAVLASWRRQALLGAVCTIAVIFCFILLLRTLAMQLQRLERSRATLVGQNAMLIKIEAQVRYLAHHDDLTNLINRRNFRKTLEKMIGAADTNGQRVTVLYLDLDRFKQINDARGHAVGDKLLIQVAARLHDGLRDSDVLARTGGDEFAVIRSTNDDRTALTNLATNLLLRISKPFEIDDVQCRIGMSIGIATYPDQAGNVSDLLRNADIALFRAKADGRGLSCIFDEAIDIRQQHLFLLEQELRRALELNQFQLNYQPIVEADTRRIICYEALLRWHHPERGPVPPGDFIAIAEHLGMMGSIGHWVLATACREATNWPASVGISVNLSPIQLNDEGFVDQVAGILRRTGLAPDRLSLEVTEGLLLENNKNVLNIMDRLNRLGVRFALDDFGKGHAGLGYLRQFPFAGIKIDKFFVDDIVDEPAARAIVAALITVSVALNLSVVAEGVETEAQLSTLRSLGCKHIQGYLTGRPAAAKTIKQAGLGVRTV